jgi:peptidoglycan/xylan/chitin deacetylase (PgdA/CDA1 family)
VGWSTELASVLFRAPGATEAFLALTRPRRYLILCYHRVNDDAHPYFTGTPLVLFRRQMEALRRHFTVLPLEELSERARARDLPANAVAITFDDGYRDNFQNAFPILRELSLPATIFLTTDAVDRNALLWHDRVFDAFARTGRPRPPLRPLLEQLRRSTPVEREGRIERLLDELAIEPGASAGWEKLSWDQVREMSSHGVSFGAHTLDHSILTSVSKDEARRQIRESKKRIDSELGRPVRAFAYPNGSASDFDESIESMVAEEGFSLAVTTLPGANDGRTHPFRLRRTGMWGSDPRLSVLRLALSRRSRGNDHPV